MNQFPQSPDMAHAQQPPTYQDPNQQAHFQQAQMYQQPQQYAGSPPPQQPYQGTMMPQSTGHMQHPQNPGMPPQQPSGTVYQTATPIANLNRSPAPADCPACGQRAMTNVLYETGNTTQ